MFHSFHIKIIVYFRRHMKMKEIIQQTNKQENIEIENLSITDREKNIDNETVNIDNYEENPEETNIIQNTEKEKQSPNTKKISRYITVIKTNMNSTTYVKTFNLVH